MCDITRQKMNMHSEAEHYIIAKRCQFMGQTIMKFQIHAQFEN